MSDQAVDAFANVEQTLAAVEEHLQVLKQDGLEGIVAELSPLEKAKVQVSLAYSVNALLYVFLKTQGVSAKDIRQTHVKQELERVKTFIKKIKDTEELAKGPKLALDKDVSKRMVHSALSSDQVYVDALAAKKDAEGAVEAEEAEGDVKEETAGNKKQKSKARAASGKASDTKSKRRRKQ